MILENRQESLMILRNFGFVLSPENDQLVFCHKDGSPWSFNMKRILHFYSSSYISAKLFDLACNQLILKYPQCLSQLQHDQNMQNIVDYNQSTSGVYVLTHEQDSSRITPENDFLSLTQQLLLLPNQYYCCMVNIFSSNCNVHKSIWILNNNGKEYQNIDWDNMNLNDLIMQLPPGMTHDDHLINYIENWLNNNEFVFLKKVLYFVKQCYEKENLNSWPNYRHEYVMMQVKRFHKNIGYNPHLIENIDKICQQLENECDMKHHKPHQIISILSTRVDQFVKNIVIPHLKLSRLNLCAKTLEKNIQLLKQKTHGQCFICQNNISMNNIYCPQCNRNKSLFKIIISTENENNICIQSDTPTVLSLNHFELFRHSNFLFDVKKSFGVLRHINDLDEKVTAGKRSIKINGKSYDVTKYQNFVNETKNHVVVTINRLYCDFCKYSILFDVTNALTIGELKTVIYALERWMLGRKESFTKHNELLYFSFDPHPIFGKMSDEEIIPQTKDFNPYFVDGFDEMREYERIQPKYKIHFGTKHCNYQCPFMMAVSLKRKDTDKFNLDPFEHCPYFTDKFDNDQDKVLDHLSNFDHFRSFNVVQNHCDYKENCAQYKNVLNQISSSGIIVGNNINQGDLFQDKKHLYLYFHPLANSIDGIGTWYDYADAATFVEREKRHIEWTKDVANRGTFLTIVRLLQEVVRNGFIKDLLPITDVYPMYDDKEFILKQFETIIHQGQLLQTSSKNVKNNIQSRKSKKSIGIFETELEKFLRSAFGIFKQVSKKMKHSRFKKMGCPLKDWQILALILYCNGDCNYDLTLCQRNGSYDKKWAMFDSAVCSAIEVLSKFEEHWENLYSGACDVFYRFKDNDKICDKVYFTTNVSFTTDLQIAKQFRGSTGMIVGLNIKRLYTAALGNFWACDVSWISGHPWEKEILCARLSQIYFYRNKMTETYTKDGEKQQWFVCDEGNLQETSFQAMFSA